MAAEAAGSVAQVGREAQAQLHATSSLCGPGSREVQGYALQVDVGSLASVGSVGSRARGRRRREFRALLGPSGSSGLGPRSGGHSRVTAVTSVATARAPFCSRTPC